LPLTLAQASKLEGMTPAAMTLLAARSRKAAIINSTEIAVPVPHV
jgi:hypothetical protein